MKYCLTNAIFCATFVVIYIMNVDRQANLKRISDCRDLYLKYGGQQHELVEQEMRDLGYTDFHRRILYRRFERGRCTSGWIERYGFDAIIRQQRQDAKLSRAVAASHTDGPAASDSDGADAMMSENAPHFPQPENYIEAPYPLNDFDDFKNWLKQVSPTMNWEWKHQVYIYKHLKRVYDGHCKRLMIFLPPRHGKSELVTVRYAAWLLKLDPSQNVIIGSYNQRLANRFSRKIRRVLSDDAAIASELQIPSSESGTGSESPPVARNQNLRKSNPEPETRNPELNCQSSMFPFTRSRQANSEAEWETRAGGGLRAVGVGSGVTGFGANMIIVDDPIKSRAEAESETIRENIWDWFNDDLYTRLEPNGAIILIQTRWHEDDLAGRLLRESREVGGEKWEVVNLPALAQEGERERNVEGELIDSADESPFLTDSSSPLHGHPDPINRQPGEALCPDRYDKAALERLKRKLGSYSFAALYQQRPVPAEGGLFKRAWFKNIVAAPPQGLRWKRGYDPGVSGQASADYTASLRIAYDREGNIYIDGGFRKQIEYPELRRYILGRILAERDTEHGIELSANGHAVIQDLRRERQIQGRALRGVKVSDTKVARALPWIALAEAGKVYLVRGPWNTEFIEEAASFPSGTHDDQIDAVSIAVRMAREQNRRFHVFL